jgi:hypothetical protein
MCATAPGAPLCRTLSDRARDVLSVKDFGAKLDGSDDTAAFDAARRSVTRPGQRIVVPDGTRVTSRNPGGAVPVWWDVLGGLTFPGGTPSVEIGDDLTSSVLDGSTRVWHRTNRAPNGRPVFRIDRTDDYTTENFDGIGSAQTTYCNTKGRTQHVYCNVTIMGINSTGGVDHYALVSVAERMADSAPGASSPAALYTELKDSTNLPDSASNGNSGMAMAEMDFYTNGTDRKNIRTLMGFRIGSYESTFKATTTAGSTTISGFSGLKTAMLPANGVSGACVPPGTKVARYNHGAQTAVLTKPANSTGTCDFDLDIVLGEVGNGFDLSPSGRGGKVGQGYAVNMPFYAAGFDTSAGTSINNAPAFKMAAKQRIAFDGTGRGHQAGYNRSLFWDSGLLTYQTQKGPVFQVSDDGAVTAFGVMSAPILSIPDVAAPTNTNDPSGTIGEVRFAGQHMYRKTSLGWLRYAGSKF